MSHVLPGRFDEYLVEGARRRSGRHRVSYRAGSSGWCGTQSLLDFEGDLYYLQTARAWL